MQKQTSLYIPKPCHEDWNKMTPTQQGKFCAGCNKQVVDFSLMSDNQILNFLSNQTGKLCGRFDTEQLQRPLIETKIKKKKSWWMALAMPLLFLFERNSAQGSPSILIDTAISSIEKQPEVMGKLVYHPTKKIIVTGSVIDENSKPLSFASVYQKGTNHGTTTDSLGNFSLNLNTNDDSVTLVVSYVGYETIEKQINVNEGETIIEMQTKPMRLNDDVVVTSIGYTTGKITLGGAIAVCRRTTIHEKIDTALRKILNIPAFKIYPNPTTKSSAIHVEIKQPGEYQLQLLDNQSRLIKAEEINVATKNSSATIIIPSNISAGVYYLCLLDEQTKKRYTEKLIIQ